MANRKVNLFLVGAMRAGTTSLVELLSRHPDIYVPPIKEPNYFTEDLPKELYSPPKNFSIDRYFEKDFPKKRLHIAHIKKKEHYEKLYSGATNEKYLLDASTAYLHAPGVAQRIYEYNPEAKIIVLLRDPWERMISHFRMNLGLMREKRTFQELVQVELELYNNDKLPWFGCLSMSLYERHISYYSHFFSNNMLVLNSRDLFNKSETSINRIRDFLAIYEFGEVAQLAIMNDTKNLRLQKALFYLNTLGLKDHFSFVLNSSIKKRVFWFLTKRKTTHDINVSRGSQDELNTILKEDYKMWNERVSN